VDEPLAEEAIDVHLPRQGAAGRAGAERGAGGLPVAVGVALEVGDEDIRPVGGGSEDGQEEREEEAHRRLRERWRPVVPAAAPAATGSRPAQSRRELGSL